MQSENQLGKFVFALMGWTFFLLAGFLVISRANLQRHVPGDPSSDSYAMVTYQDEVYFPVRALITGTNPYANDYTDFHPDGHQPDRLSPSTLLIHLPLGFLSIRESEIAFLILQVAFAFLLALLIFRASKRPIIWSMVATVAGLVLICRPGLDEAYFGGLTFLMALGVGLALFFSRTNRFLAGLGFWITSCNLFFALPLGVFLFFRRNFGALVWGLSLTAVSWFSVAWFVTDGQQSDIYDLAKNEYWSLVTEPFSSEADDSATLDTWNRVDALPVVNMIERYWATDAKENDIEAVSPNESPRSETMDLETNKIGLPTDWRLVSQNSNPTPTASSELSKEWQTYVARLSQRLGRGLMVTIACLLVGALCLLANGYDQQQLGLIGVSGAMIIVMMLLSVRHEFGHSLILWVPVVGILIGAPQMAAGFGKLASGVIVLALIIPLFNFLTPELVALQLGISPGSWQWDCLAIINSIAVMVAALVIILRMLFSWGARSETSVAAE